MVTFGDLNIESAWYLDLTNKKGMYAVYFDDDSGLRVGKTHWEIKANTNLKDICKSLDIEHIEEGGEE